MNFYSLIDRFSSKCVCVVCLAEGEFVSRNLSILTRLKAREMCDADMLKSFDATPLSNLDVGGENYFADARICQ